MTSSTTGRRRTAIVAGALARQPGRAGHAWVFVNWLLGFQRLGYDVLFLDRVDTSLSESFDGIRWVRDVMAAMGIDVYWGVRVADGTYVGMRERDVMSMADDSILLNVMGYFDDPEVLARAGRRIFLDIDPGFGQAWQSYGLAEMFAGHDVYATVGLNVGTPSCLVPDLGIDWVHTLPPVDLDAWASSVPPGGAFNTVASWRGPFAPIEIDGVVHGLRVHQARPLADLPITTGLPLEIALDIDPTDASDRLALLAGGWSLADAATVAADLGTYRRYVHGSLGEFAVAKQAYVGLSTGWFSDRSACYLASGRAVVVSDTGLSGHLPLGEGLLVYTDRTEATEALGRVAADPAMHGKAARALAEEFFDARTVVESLVTRAEAA